MAEKGWKERMKDSFAKYEKTYSKIAILLFCVAATCCGMWVSGEGSVFGWVALVSILIVIPLGILALVANNINVQREIDAIYNR